ncbi:hypothetical protein D3C80_911050 [compost metagenome]
MRPLITLRAGRAAMRIAKGGDVNAQQLQFGAHVRARKRVFFPGKLCRRHAGHLIARRHQAKDFTFPQGAFADGKHVFIRGAATVIDANPAAFTEGESTSACQGVLRADPGGKDHHIGVQLAAIGKTQDQAVIGAGDFSRRFAGVYTNAEGLDFAAQHRRTVVIKLNRHQVRGEFDHVRFQPQLLKRIRGFQP